MPIYAYRCEACGHAKDVIQKFSDAPLTVCPECQADAFRKQLTAPAFQLKGSGWYVTDFRDQGNKGKAPAKTAEGGEASSDSSAAGTDAPAAAPAAAAAPSPSTGGAATGGSSSAASSSSAPSSSGPTSSS